MIVVVLIELFSLLFAVLLAINWKSEAVFWEEKRDDWVARWRERGDEIDELKGELLEADTEIDDVSAERDKLKEDLLKANEALTQVRKSHQIICGQLESLRDQRNRLIDTADDLTAHVKDIRENYV